MLTTKNSTLFHNNYEKIWNEIKLDLERWRKLQLSLLGRISTIKMNVLPKMLFLFQTLPILANEKIFKLWQKDISKFIWQGKKPRIKFKLLQDAKERGGLGLPDFKLYSEACCFLWIREWLTLENQKLLLLEGHEIKFGWHAYIWYEKVKINK